MKEKKPRNSLLLKKAKILCAKAKINTPDH